MWRGGLVAIPYSHLCLWPVRNLQTLLPHRRVAKNDGVPPRIPGLIGAFQLCCLWGAGPRTNQMPYLATTMLFPFLFLLNGHLFGSACISDGEPGGSEFWRWKGGLMEPTLGTVLLGWG